MSLPDGWAVFDGPSDVSDGRVVAQTKVARKWFGDHWKEVTTLESQLEAALAQIELEVATRILGDQQAALATADDLTAQAEAIQADVDSADKPEIVQGGDAPNASAFAYVADANPPEIAPEPVTVDQDAEPAPPVTVPSDAEVHDDPDAVRAEDILSPEGPSEGNAPEGSVTPADPAPADPASAADDSAPAEAPADAPAAADNAPA